MLTKYLIKEKRVILVVNFDVFTNIKIEDFKDFNKLVKEWKEAIEEKTPQSDKFKATLQMLYIIKDHLNDL